VEQQSDPPFTSTVCLYIVLAITCCISVSEDGVGFWGVCTTAFASRLDRSFACGFLSSEVLAAAIDVYRAQREGESHGKEWQRVAPAFPKIFPKIFYINLCSFPVL